MFRRILIANRGEVAARLMRTCRRLGIHTVAVYSTPDAQMSYLEMADQTVEIGPKSAYLDQDAIINAAIQTRCSAIHPGWGFLSENSTFASRCEAAGFTFVGPTPANMRAMGDKSQARAEMQRLAVPVIAGDNGPIYRLDHAKESIAQIGYPVMIKAISGGGGRGMRTANRPGEVESAYNQAVAEAIAAFGDGAMYLERRIQGGRHIEFQVMSDGCNAHVYLERECSIQRRNQKLIEETPSPSMSPEVRAQMQQTLKSATLGMGYRGAGTFEMLRDKSGQLYFMEMNTRLQVEHTVTEMVTGCDLVEAQLRIAANQPLPNQPNSLTGGHAIECRINAEDPFSQFRPSPGTIDVLKFPEGEGIRVDTHLRQGDRVSPHYDSMIAKVCAHGATRAQAISRMVSALSQTVVGGIQTTIPVHLGVLGSSEFLSGNYDTNFLEENIERLLGPMT